LKIVVRFPIILQIAVKRILISALDNECNGKAGQQAPRGPSLILFWPFAEKSTFCPDNEPCGFAEK
jgi:hypothetical protein